MKACIRGDNLAIAWEFPGQILVIIPAEVMRLRRPTPPQPPCTLADIKVDVLKDDYPDETWWTLTNYCTGILVDSNPWYLAPGALYSNTYCLPPDEYTFEIVNDCGNCGDSQLSYKVTLDGEVVASGADF